MRFITMPPALFPVPCNFGVYPNMNTCGWVNNKDAALVWQTGSGQTSNWLGGPTNDFSSDDSSGELPKLGFVYCKVSVCCIADQIICTETCSRRLHVCGDIADATASGQKLASRGHSAEPAASRYWSRGILRNIRVSYPATARAR
jgi:hypothetical protein